MNRTTQSTVNPAIFDAIFAGVTSEAGAKAAYRAAAARLHPDVNKEFGAHEMFLALQAAYELTLARIKTTSAGNYWQAQQERERQRKEAQREAEEAMARERKAREEERARKAAERAEKRKAKMAAGRSTKAKLASAKRVLESVCKTTGWVWTEIKFDADGDIVAEFADGECRAFWNGQWVRCTAA